MKLTTRFLIFLAFSFFCRLTIDIQTETNRIVSIHEIKLLPGVDPQDFEDYVHSTIAPVYNSMEGQEFILVKGDRGDRKDKYGIVLIFDSVDDRDRIYPGEGDSPEDWGKDDIWQKFKSLSTGLGTPETDYTDYVEL